MPRHAPSTPRPAAAPSPAAHVVDDADAEVVTHVLHARLHQVVVHGQGPADVGRRAEAAGIREGLGQQARTAGSSRSTAAAQRSSAGPAGAHGGREVLGGQPVAAAHHDVHGPPRALQRGGHVKQQGLSCGAWGARPGEWASGAREGLCRCAASRRRTQEMLETNPPARPPPKHTHTHSSPRAHPQTRAPWCGPAQRCGARWAAARPACAPRTTGGRGGPVDGGRGGRERGAAGRAVRRPRRARRRAMRSHRWCGCSACSSPRRPRPPALTLSRPTFLPSDTRLDTAASSTSAPEPMATVTASACGWPT